MSGLFGGFGNTLNQPRQKKHLANINADQVNSNQQAQIVKYLAGRRYLAGDNISPAYNRVVKAINQTANGKTESAGEAHVYYADFALVFCMGGRMPVHGIRTIIQDSEIIWSGTVDFGAAESVTITVEHHGVITLYKGSFTQPIDSVLLTPRGALPGGVDSRDQSTWPKNPASGSQTTDNSDASGDANPLSGHYDKHPAYRGQCYAVFKNWKLGRERTAIPNLQFELIRDVPWFGSTSLASNDLGVNPAGVLYDWLTDDLFGRGLPESQLLQSSFTTLQPLIDDMRLSVLLTNQDDFTSVIAKLLEFFDGWIRRNGAQLEVGYWSHGNIDTSGLPTLYDDDLEGDPQLKPGGWGDTSNAIQLTYCDRLHHFNDYPQTYRDSNNRRIVGEWRFVELDRRWITDAALAKRYATEYGVMAAQPGASGTLSVKRESLSALGLLPGMRFNIDSLAFNLDMTCRLNRIQWPADNCSKATLDVEAERGVWPSNYIAPPTQQPGDFVTGPFAIVNKRVFELPPMMKDPNGGVVQVAMLAQKSFVELSGFRSYVSQDNSTYDLLDESTGFAVFGKLDVDYIAGTSNPDVTTGAVMWLYGAGLDEIVSQSDQVREDNALLLIIDNEVMSVGQVTPLGAGKYKIFVKRAVYQTTQALHTAGTACWLIFRDRLQKLSNRNFIAGASPYFKLVPFTQLQDFDISTATAFTYTFSTPTTYADPGVSPGTGTYSTAQTVALSADAGLSIYYTLDGTDPSARSVPWPTSGGSYTTLSVSTNCILSVIGVAADGTTTRIVRASYTFVSSGTPTPSCSQITFSFSGTKGSTGGNLTLNCAQSGVTKKYQLNGGSTTTYTTAFHIALGDVVDAWAEKTSFNNSITTEFNNTASDPGGGGGGGGGHQLP